MIIVIGQPRRELIQGLQCRAGGPDARDIGVIECRGNVPVEVCEGQRELQCQRHQREIRSASLGQDPCRHHFRPAKRAVPV